MGRRNLPRDEIRNAYILGIKNEKGERIYPTYEELRRKYGVSYDTLSRWAKQENWLKLREENRKALLEKSEKRTVEILADEIAENNRESFLGARDAFRLGRAGLREYYKQLQEIKDDPNLTPEQRSKALYGLSGAYRNYTQSMVNAQKIARLAMGVATENVSVSDWRSELLELMKRGVLTREEIEAELGELSEGLFTDVEGHADEEQAGG